MDWILLNQTNGTKQYSDWYELEAVEAVTTQVPLDNMDRNIIKWHFWWNRSYA